MDMTDITVRNLLYWICPQSLRKYWDGVQASSISSRMVHGAFWALGGAVISRVPMLLAFICVARILGRNVYGEFGVIRNTLNMFLVFAGFGLGLTATKYVAEYRCSDPNRTGRILALSGVFAAGSGALVAMGMYIFSPWLASHTINAPHLAGELRLGAVVLFLSALNGAQTGALAGFEAFKTIAKINIIVGLASFPTLVCGSYWSGLHGAILALCANMSFSWLLNHLALRRVAACYMVPFTTRGCFAEWSVLWKFSLPAALSGIMVSPIFWVCNAILVNQPGGYGQMGIYDAASQWQAIILFIPGVVGQIVLPILSNLNGLAEQKKSLKIIYYNLMVNGGISCVIALPLVAFSPFIMRSYGAGFEQGTSTLVILSVCTVFISLNNVIGQSIASKSRMWSGLLLNSLWAATLLLSSFFLMRSGYGATGLALANLIAYLLHTIFVSVYAYKLFRGQRV